MHVRILSTLVLLAAPTLAAGEPAPPAERVIDCALPSTVYLEDANGERSLVGTTPTLDWRGLRVPANTRVCLVFNDEGKASPTDLIREIAVAANVLGVDALVLECTAPPPETFWDELASVKGLRSLGGLELSDLNAKELARFPKLAVLECKPLSNAALEAVAAHAPKLERLVLNGAEFNSDGLACLEKFPALRSLRIADRKLDEVGLTHIARIQGLRRLELDFSELDVPSTQRLAAMPLSFFRAGQIEWSDEKLGLRLFTGAPVLDAQGLRDIFHPKPYAGDPLAGEVDGLIRALDSEEFPERQAATEKLLTLKPEASPWLRARTQALRNALSLEQQSRLHEILDALEDPQHSARVRQIAEELDRAVEEAPAQYRPPSPLLQEKLARRIHFTFEDATLAAAAASLAPRLGAPVFVDSYGSLQQVPISLSITNMRMELALDWIAKLADAQIVRRGDAVIFTKSDRARALRLQEVFYDLPSAKGEAPWTDAESAWFCTILAARTPLPGRLKPRELEFLTMESCGRTNDGRLRVVADPEMHKELERVMAEFAHPPFQEPPVTPTWLEKMERALDDHIEFENASGLSVFGAIQQATNLPLPVEGELKFSDETITMKGTMRDALLLAAENAKAVLLPEAGRLVRVDAHAFGGLPATRRIFDVRPVLAAGVKPAELAAAVKELFAPIGVDPTAEPFPLRGRFIAAVDPWTEQRVFAVLKAAARTGKIPELPPVPWFFQTLKSVEQLQPTVGGEGRKEREEGDIREGRDPAE